MQTNNDDFVAVKKPRKADMQVLKEQAQERTFLSFKNKWKLLLVGVFAFTIAVSVFPKMNYMLNGDIMEKNKQVKLEQKEKWENWNFLQLLLLLLHMSQEFGKHCLIHLLCL